MSIFNYCFICNKRAPEKGTGFLLWSGRREFLSIPTFKRFWELAIHFFINHKLAHKQEINNTVYLIGWWKSPWQTWLLFWYSMGYNLNLFHFDTGFIHNLPQMITGWCLNTSEKSLSNESSSLSLAEYIRGYFPGIYVLLAARRSLFLTLILNSEWY